MNLTEQIMEQFSGDALGKLSSLLGTDGNTAKKAASAAVPSLMAALSGLMSNDVGAKKLSSVLGGLDTSGPGNLAQLLGGDTSSLMGKGTSLLGSLFSDSIVSGLSSAVSRFSGMNVGIVKNLLAMLTPLLLGKVASQWKSQGGTTQALKSLFADQQRNITNALPSGFSLPDVPGLADFKRSAQSVGRGAVEAEKAAAGSLANWLLPLAILLIGGYLLWHFLAGREVPKVAVDKAKAAVEKTVDKTKEIGENVAKAVVPESIAVPDLAKLKENFGGLFKSMDSALSGIKDAATAEAAKPALQDLNTKIDAMNEVLSKLPEASATALRPFLEEQIKAAAEKANAASSAQGISTDVKSLIQQIISKITKWITAATGAK